MTFAIPAGDEPPLVLEQDMDDYVRRTRRMQPLPGQAWAGLAGGLEWPLSWLYTEVTETLISSTLA